MALRLVLDDVDFHHERNDNVAISQCLACFDPELIVLSRLVFLLMVVSIVSWFVRYRFHFMYARLPPEPQRKEPQIDLFPDTQEGDSKPGLANYLDEFLEAIKVFGYLERPVFHELTRTMQTRKLIAGETLLLEEEKGFCLVVDGLVQIFVKSLQEKSPMHHEEPIERSFRSEEQHAQGRLPYQLLTEVKNGAPMSSLFSILSLFTEDVKLRSDDASSESSTSRQTRGNSISFALTPSNISSSPLKSGLAERRPPMPDDDSKERLSTVPPLKLDSAVPTPDRETSPQARVNTRSGPPPKSVHPDIVARAMIDTTIAIIPASAFRRLTRTYPKATAHIVQVILTRLQRVTLSTAHQYLGLTKEVLHMEELMNRYTNHDLPNHLKGDTLARLKEKFANARGRMTQEEIMNGIALHNPVSSARRAHLESTGKVQYTQDAPATALQVRPPSNIVVEPAKDSEGHVSPGDLMSNLQLSKGERRSDQTCPTKKTIRKNVDSSFPVTSLLARWEQPLFRPGPQNGLLQRQQSKDEDSIFREAVLGCMINSLGLTMNPKDVISKDYQSVEHSPRLMSYDWNKQTAIFGNAFGFLDPYEASADGETESPLSASVASLGLHGRTLDEELMGDVEIVFFPQGSVLVEQGERNPGVYYVIDGFLDVSTLVEEKDDMSKHEPTISAHDSGHRSFPDHLPGLPPKRETQPSRTGIRRSRSKEGRQPKRRKSLFLIKPGGIAGYIGTVSSYRSFTNVTAKTDVYVGFLPRASLERLTERSPVVLLTMAKRLTSLLPRLILHIDFALEWVQVNAGQVIHHQGDDSDAIYIVLNGRLRSVLEKQDGRMQVVGEFGQGESIGELEVMTESTRPSTLHAIRDTELAKFPRSLFNSLAQEHPGITIQITKLVARRMRALIDQPLLEKGSEIAALTSPYNVRSTLNLRTVTILPVTSSVPVVDFGHRLLAAFAEIGMTNGVTSLNQAAILNVLGRHAFSRMGKLKLSQYLADLEEKFGMVLYVADTSVNAPWTQTCITQADCILLVGLAEDSPEVGDYERFLLGMKTTARKELVLLHAERYCPPGRTREWLKNRVWINGGHHHIQMAFTSAPGPAPSPQVRRFGSAIKQRVQVIQAEIQKYTSRRVRQTPTYSAESPYKGDFHRLARRLCGKSVGLVLGGGGARGISQIGIIRALEEAGVPIDLVGGTSIGAFIGALYARDAGVVPTYGRAKRFAGRMSSMWRYALDLTYPSASYTTGHEFNRTIFKAFGNSQIEDFWLEFYCNTTNISKSRSEIHTSGYVWRYVRASMSLAGLIPPLCDEGSMLLDGGYVDNLTVSHMKSLGADVVFAVDVGSLDDTMPQQFGDSLSGLWAVFNRWNPFSWYPNPPTLSEIQGRLAYVSSHDALERAKTTPGCQYMRPPIDSYGTLEFSKFEEIYETGYAYGKEFLARIREQGHLRGIIGHWDESEEVRGLRRTMAPRRASI